MQAIEMEGKPLFFQLAYCESGFASKSISSGSLKRTTRIQSDLKALL